ncbi:MAG TPA: hypothetical protein VGC79_04545 [Polyangiaceae bacterium]
MSEPATIFLLSPANLSGRRGAMLLDPSAQFQLARELRSSEGAELGELFSFVSSLYFRGKLAYARAFGGAKMGQEAAYVISAGGGLCRPHERFSLARLQGWANVSIHQDNPHYSAPLIRHANKLLEGSTPGTRFVLLGSVASAKYVEPLLDVFGPALFFPEQFAGLGDMSRGALLLRAVRDGHELTYASVASWSKR